MAKRKTRTVTIKHNKDGTITFRSTGIDLRKVLPSLFQSIEPDSDAAPLPQPQKGQSDA